MFELDHLFICADIGAPEAERLVEFGLVEGEPNVHAGQGTACRRFFFQNAYLELLWVNDPAEVQSEITEPTLLWPRWSQRHAAASPFGVCLRPTAPGLADVPFATWEYRPSYLPSPLAIHMSETAHLSEPLWFHLGFSGPPAESRLPRGANKFHMVTHVRVTGPFADEPSEAAQAVAKLGIVELIKGAENFLEMTFDDGSQQCLADFRPGLPLVFRW